MDQQNYSYDEDIEYIEDENYNYSYDNDNQEYLEQSNLAYSNFQDYGNQKTKKQYQIIPYNSLFAELKKNIHNAHQMTAFAQGWCVLLLRQFKWDVESMAEYFHNIEKYQIRIGYKTIYKHPNSPYQKQNGSCDVCCAENVSVFENICGHSFCQQCWKGKLLFGLNNNQPFQRCMDCECPILYETFQKYLQNFFPQNKKYIDKYEKILSENFSSIHRNYQFCTGIDCHNCIKVYNLNLRSVRCTCGKVFCFKCKCDDHSPCSCQQRKSWLETVIKQQADAKWMSVNTKLCPWCKKAVERSAGCNFMSCICGKNFCYLCSRPWEPDHKDHFKCHIYKKSESEHLNRQKQILQKMNFYTQRFLDNQKNAEENKKFKVFEKRKELFNTLKIELSDSQFIDYSYRFCIECCETLKWINAYSYYVKWENEMQKQKFQFYQGQFQMYKVNLLKLLAVDLKNFFKKVQYLEKDNILLESLTEELHFDFKIIKSNIVNYTTMTKKYKEKFIEEIQKKAELQDTLIKKNYNNKSGKPIKLTAQKQIQQKIKTKPDNKKQNQTISGTFFKYLHR